MLTYYDPVMNTYYEDPQIIVVGWILLPPRPSYWHFWLNGVWIEDWAAKAAYKPLI